MIIIILLCLLGTMVFIYMQKRNLLSLWMVFIFMASFSCVLGFMYYYAKSGGISDATTVLLFLHPRFKKYLMYTPISLDIINNLIVVGRSLFMYSTLCFALEVNGSKKKSTTMIYRLMALVFPLFFIIAYQPDIYRRFFIDSYLLLNAFTRLIIIVYTFLTFALLFYKWKQMTVKWIKKQLRYIGLAIISINLLFYLFGFFNSMQVSDPNTLGYLSSTFALLYSSVALSPWYIIICLAVIFLVIGYYFLYQYIKIEEHIGRPDLFVEKKLKTAHMGARVFTHGIKNQLLTSRILLRRARKGVLDETYTKEDMLENIEKLEELNNQMLNRMDSLYRTFKNNTIKLQAVTMDEVLMAGLEKLGDIPNGIDLHVQWNEKSSLLGDLSHLSECIYNILKNSVDAIEATSCKTGYIIVKSRLEGDWNVVEITDTGIGIDKDNINKIFDPFYTSKNTNYNWGVGLSYVQQILNAHYGSVRMESQLNKGTSFFIFIPVYRETFNKEKKIKEKSSL